MSAACCGIGKLCCWKPVCCGYCCIIGCVAIVCWLSSRDAKRSIKGALADGFEGAAAGGWLLGAFDAVGLESWGFDDPFVALPPFFFASFSARYCLRLISKSLSLRYSSKLAAKLVGACLIFGISSLVECSCERARLRYWTTASVCLTKVRYMARARVASGFESSK